MIDYALRSTDGRLTRKEEMKARRRLDSVQLSEISLHGRLKLDKFVAVGVAQTAHLLLQPISIHERENLKNELSQEDGEPKDDEKDEDTWRGFR
eukprot:5782143-Prymnesium_polylepis.1